MWEEGGIAPTLPPRRTRRGVERPAFSAAAPLGREATTEASPCPPAGGSPSILVTLPAQLKKAPAAGKRAQWRTNSVRGALKTHTTQSARPRSAVTCAVRLCVLSSPTNQLTRGIQCCRAKHISFLGENLWIVRSDPCANTPARCCWHRRGPQKRRPFLASAMRRGRRSMRRGRRSTRGQRSKPTGGTMQFLAATGKLRHRPLPSLLVDAACHSCQS